jgi:SPP1 family predicted phage head-tail adaptor
VWSTVVSTRAYIKPISGGERLQALRVESDITQRVFIRYRTGLLPSDRINYGGRLMEIKAILNLEEMNKWFEIYATEGQAT